METKEIREKTNSIKVTKTSTGKYSFEIKIYAEDLTNDIEWNKIKTKIKERLTDLSNEYENKT